MLPDWLDEPELGLHPAAITLIGDMIQVLAKERQIIVSPLLPFLGLVLRETQFRRLDPVSAVA